MRFRLVWSADTVGTLGQAAKPAAGPLILGLLTLGEIGRLA